MAFSISNTTKIPEALVEEIISFLPQCSKCKTVVWIGHTLNTRYMNCHMCSKLFCYSCLNHNYIRYYEGYFDLCQTCVHFNNYVFRGHY